MKKFSIDPNPTFRFPVAIPVPGGQAADVVFTFRHKTKTEMNDLIKRAETLSEVDLIMEVACGWELVDQFTTENVTRMIDNYIGSAGAIFSAYIGELTKVREKN